MGKSGSDESEDFGAILEAFEREQSAAGSGQDPKVGERVSGTVLTLAEDAAFVDLGGKTEGMVHLAELIDDDGELTVAVGDVVEGLVAARDPASGCLVIRVRSGRGTGGDAVAREELRQAQEHRIPVEGTVREVVKGGVTVDVLGMRGFCPISQLDLRYVEDASEYVGQRLSFRVTRYEEGGRGGRTNVVLSRRELLEEEAKARAEEARARLEVGKKVQGTVTSVTRYGAFVDLGGIEGLLHVSEMAHGRVEDPAQLYSPGQEVEVEVLEIAPGRKPGQPERISLSRRSLERDPWEGAASRYPEGRRVEGKVVRVEPFGAFVELEPGLEGLVHVSELGLEARVRDAREAVEPGRTVEVRVIGIEPARRRISLSMGKGADEHELREEVERYRRTKPSDSGGFGSLADFFKDGKLDK